LTFSEERPLRRRVAATIKKGARSKVKVTAKGAAVMDERTVERSPELLEFVIMNSTGS
jgi:hypothetical protein